MILLDLSPTIISSFLATHTDKSDINEDYIRHLILNCIRSYNSKFRNRYGQMVICCDGPNNWRKEIFPYYKASRKKSREESTFNWPKLFEITTKIREEIRDNFPYKTLIVDRAEADDIIAVLVKHRQEHESILIISPDGDFKQLQKYPSVRQYNPIKKNMVECQYPDVCLQEYILFGDKGDGVPNFLSSDDTFVENKRQKPIRQAKVDTWVTLDPKDYCDEYMLRNYMRNKTLIDFECIPVEISDSILKAYDNSVMPQEGKGLFDYFMKNKLSNLIGSLSDF